MPNFLIDNTVLPADKINKRAVPSNQEKKYAEASEWNQIVNAATDLRDFLRATVPVNLRAVGCIPRDATKALDNVNIIRGLMAAAKAANNRPLVLVADDDFSIDMQSTHHSILFEEGSKNQFIVGTGRFASGFTQEGYGTGADWWGIVADRVQNCGVLNLGFKQGVIRVPSTGQHDHLIQVANFGGSTDFCDFTISGCYFGKATGDCVNLYGGTGRVRMTMRDCDINGAGFVLRQWTPSTTVIFGEMVRNGSNCYYCTTAGITAASGGGPSTTGAGIADGTVVWTTLQGGATFRKGARSGIAFQRGYDAVLLDGIRIKGVQNSAVDMEATGVGRCEHTHFANCDFEQSLAVPGVDAYGVGVGVGVSNTSTIMSFSGSGSLTDPSKYSTIRNLTLRNGCIQIAETRGAAISGLRVIMDTSPAGDVNQALLYTLRDNEGLRFRDLTLVRTGAAAAGPLVSFQGTGRIRIEGACELQQDTAANIFEISASADDPTIVAANGGVSRELDRLSIENADITYNGATPTSRYVFNISATANNSNGLRVDGCRFKSTTGALAAMFALSTRNGFSMKNVSVTRNQVTDGSLAKLVYVDKQAGAPFDPNPIIQANDPGVGVPVFTAVDSLGAPLTSLYPLTAGNKGGVYTLTGTVDPNGNVIAPPGTRYVWVNGDSTKVYEKKTGTGFAGWGEVTVGAASVAGFRLIASGNWATHIAEYGLTGWSAPTRQWNFQDASGNAAAALGGIALTAAGTLAYQQDETAQGYTAKSIRFSDNDADSLQTADAGLPDPATTSMLRLTIQRILSVPAAARSWMQLSLSNQIRMVNVSGQARARIFFVGNDLTPAFDLDTTGFHIWVEQVNETANTAYWGHEGLKVNVPYIAPSSSTKLLGYGAISGDLNSPAIALVQSYEWEGAAAERTIPQIRAMLESMGAGAGAWVP